jgi:putative spermidine/putrescine transport system ATP-binding protein
MMLGGIDLSTVPPHRRDIGVVFQNYALFPHMTVENNVAYPLKVRGVKRREIASRVGELLSMVDLSDFAERRISQLSGGQRQRVALARALVFEPRLLLLDEPLSALDKQLRDRTQVELRRIHDRLKMTTICVTHDQTEALTMSDSIAVINSGRIVQCGSPHEIYHQPACKFVADFIGETSMISVTVADGVIRAQGRTLLTEASVRLPAAQAPADCWVGIRPERVRFLAHPDPQLNCFDGFVRSFSFRGDYTHVTVELGTGELLTARIQTRISSARPFDLGQPVLLGVDAADTMVLLE